LDYLGGYEQPPVANGRTTLVKQTRHAIQTDGNHAEPNPVTCRQRLRLRERDVEPATVDEAGHRVEIGSRWNEPADSAFAIHD
jgi:hypothetical protein